VSKCFKQDSWSKPIFSSQRILHKDYEHNGSVEFDSHDTRVEAGSNTSTVNLRVIEGEEKGSLKSDAVKYGLDTKGPRTQGGLHWRGPVAYTKDRPVLS
jgi:hypothetical protein